MVKKYSFVFVVLVYRNYMDLKELCYSIKKHVKDSYKVIVVDAFFDENTSKKIEYVSGHFDCDYIRVNNDGYGAGNNKGINYVRKHYLYDWIVICNPDTVLKTDITKKRVGKVSGIIAPDIVTKEGKHQNPYWAYKNLLSEKMIFYGYKKNNLFLVFFGVAINKVLKQAFRTLNIVSFGKIKKIYACHGSFVFFCSEFISNYKYDESIFLFYEEACLAAKAKGKHSIIFDNSIKVLHKEDGSMKLANVNEYPILKKSYIDYYKKYRMGLSI